MIVLLVIITVLLATFYAALVWAMFVTKRDRCEPALTVPELPSQTSSKLILRAMVLQATQSADWRSSELLRAWLNDSLRELDRHELGGPHVMPELRKHMTR